MARCSRCAAVLTVDDLKTDPVGLCASCVDWQVRFDEAPTDDARWYCRTCDATFAGDRRDHLAGRYHRDQETHRIDPTPSVDADYEPAEREAGRG